MFDCKNEEGRNITHSPPKGRFGEIISFVFHFEKDITKPRNRCGFGAFRTDVFSVRIVGPSSVIVIA